MPLISTASEGSASVGWRRPDHSPPPSDPPGLDAVALTLAQRHHYLVGGLGYLPTFLGARWHLFLCLATSPFLALGHPLLLRQLVGALFVLPIFMLCGGVAPAGVEHSYGLRCRLARCSPRCDGHACAELTVARACLSAVRTRGVFLPTPLVRTPSRLGKAVLATLPESVVAAACAAMALAVGIFGPPTLGAVCGVLVGLAGCRLGLRALASMLSLDIPLTPSRIAFKRSPQTTGASAVASARSPPALGAGLRACHGCDPADARAGDLGAGGDSKLCSRRSPSWCRHP